MFGDVEHRDAAALGGGEIVHLAIFLLVIQVIPLFDNETGFREQHFPQRRQVFLTVSQSEERIFTDERWKNLSDMTVGRQEASGSNSTKAEVAAFKEIKICRHLPTTKRPSDCLPCPWKSRV
ncbi:hypothetical protein EMIT0P294_10420 [Pseudomonas sp. IT-P294]|jgi:hypothetical protein